MKTLKLYSITAFVALLFIFSSSCKKDTVTPIVPPGTPDYVGTWSATAPFNSDYGVISMKDIKTFTDSIITDKFQLEITTGLWIDYASMKSSLSVKGKIMNVTITELGVTEVNAFGIPTGVIKSYKAGTPEFDALILQLGQAKLANARSFIAEYGVSGNQLTLKTDLNADGDYLDANETTVYTKQ